MSTELAAIGHNTIVSLTKFYEHALSNVMQEKAMVETLGKQSAEKVTKLESENAFIRGELTRFDSEVADLKARNARLVDALERANAADPDAAEVVNLHDNG